MQPDLLQQQPILCLHGFTHIGSQFNELSTHLDRPIVAPDLHIETEVPIELDTTLMALEDIINLIGQPLPVLGYSMGGRLALSLAIDRPDLVQRVIVVSAGPGIADAADRATRAAEDGALADRIIEVGVSTFLDGWLQRPLTSTASVDEEVAQQDRALREENSAAGLAAALRSLGQGAYPYLGDRLGDLAMPLLAVSGANDERYTEQSGALAAAVPDGRHVTIDGAGHNVVLEAPEELAAVVEEFLTGGQ